MVEKQIDKIYGDPKFGLQPSKLYTKLKDQGITHKQIHEYLKKTRIISNSKETCKTKIIYSNHCKISK